MAKLIHYTPAQLFGPQAATPEGQFWTIADLHRAVQRWYGVEYRGRNSYTELYARCGFSFQRPAKVYKSHHHEKVAEFEELIEKKVLDRAQEAPEAVYLAGDEASLYLQTTTMAVWAPRGQTPVIRSDMQRDKVNFYGTLDLHTGKEIVLRTTEMNAQTSVQHLQQILAAFPGRPIVLCWDRATWHKRTVVGNFLEAHPRLEIVHFPIGAPDLNPQEQVWKATRRAVSHNHLTPKLPQLADQFEEHLEQSTFQSSFLHRYGYSAYVCPNSI